MPRLQDKSCIVTGAARGIGLAIAEAFAAEGGRVLLTDVLTAEVQEAARRIRDRGHEAWATSHDVTDEAQWQAVVALAVERFGGLHVLVNNAGFGMRKALTDLPYDEWRRIMAINCDGVFLGMKHAIPHMTGAHGSIINISSIYGKIGGVDILPYCASKGAVTLMSKAAALECAAKGLGIRVNSLHPGFIDTPLLHEAAKGTDFIEAMRALHPIGRLGQPDDIGDAAVFLASDESRFMTGAELVVDGGFTAQ